MVCFSVKSSSNMLARELNPEGAELIMSQLQLYANKICEQLGPRKGSGESEAEPEYDIESIRLCYEANAALSSVWDWDDDKPEHLYIVYGVWWGIT